MTAVGTAKAPYEILRARCGGLVLHSVLLSIASCSVAFFLLNYATINAEVIIRPQEAAFRVAKTGLAENGVFTEDEMALLAQIDGIETVYKKQIPVSDYLAAQPIRASHNVIMTGSEQMYVATNIRLLEEDTQAAVWTDADEIPVWLNPYQPDMIYKVGDAIELYVNAISSVAVGQSLPMSEYEFPWLTGKMQLRVAGFVQAEYLDAPLQLYVLPDFYEEITRDILPSYAYLYMKEDGNIDDVRASLTQLFAGKNEYLPEDYIADAERTARSSTGLYLLVAMLTSFFLLLTALAVAILLQEFVRQQQLQNRIFFFLGTSLRNLRGVYRRIGAGAFLLSGGVSIAVSILCTCFFFAGTGYHLMLSLPTALIYLGAFAALYCAINTPMQKELRNHFLDVQ